MDYILLVISIAACLTGTLLVNSYSKKNSKNLSDMHVFNLIKSVVCALMFLSIALPSGVGASIHTVVLGVVFGLVSAISSIFSQQAYKKGPVSYTNLLIMSSMVIPALSGVMFFGESISVGKIVGILLMLVAIVMSVCNKEDKKASVAWLLCSLISALATGGVGILQKVHQSSPAKGELMWFLCIAFGVSAIISEIFVVANSKKTPITVVMDKKIILFIVACGVATMLNNVINLYLSGVMESIIFFPTVNGANILLLLVVSLVFLKERIRPLQWVGIVAGTSAIFLLCI